MTPEKSTAESCINFINSIVSGKPIILHTDFGNIIKLLHTDSIIRNVVFEEFYQLLKDCCISSSVFIPTFDYEYCSTRIYNPKTSKSQLGAFSKYCSNNFYENRTLVPVFSHVDIKGFHNPINRLYRTDTAFGSDSFYDWFTKEGGYVFFWGCNLRDSNTYMHHAETISRITYRFPKIFQGCVQTEDCLTEVSFEYHVSPAYPEISYTDQGRGILLSDNLLISHEKCMIEGFLSQDYLSSISKSLVQDEFALLTSKSRIEISKHLTNHKMHRQITEYRKSIILLSDSTLEFITHGWHSNNYFVKPHYAESLSLALEELALASRLECDMLLIMPSSDTFSLGILDSCPSRVSDIEQIINHGLESTISSIRTFRNKHSSVLITFISPFSKVLASQLADSQESELFILEIFARWDRATFNALDAINVRFETAINRNTTTNIHYSIINYLRYRYPFDNCSTNEIRDVIDQIINRQFLCTKEIKAISVDLDNTIWRGISGDENVEISKDYPSSAHLALQRVLKQLRQRGVFLTITSKNNMSTVKDTFKKLEGKMFLAIDDFSCIDANWQEKSTSLLRQSSALNIGLDSFLHIDDSELELLEIMSSIPDVETLKFTPELIDEILCHLLSHPRLRRASLTMSDRARVENSMNTVIKPSYLQRLSLGDYSYLEALKVNLAVAHQNDEAFDFKRSCQLLLKTNQFNTSQMAYDSLSASITGSFDLYNLIYSENNSIQECCSVMCTQYQSSDDELIILSYVLSCRFFSRGLEYYFLEKICNIYNPKKVSILFRRTRRNTPTYEFINSISSAKYKDEQFSENTPDLDKIVIKLSLLRLQSAKFKRYYA